MAEKEKITKNLENSFRKKKDFKNNAYEKAQVQPQARELEELVLGAIMLEQNAFDAVSDVIKTSENFYVDAHQRIYKAMIKLTEDNEPLDMYTVTEKLRTSGELEMVGGAYFIASLTNKVASSANVESHARIVVQKFLKREVISLSSQAIKDAFDDTVDVFDLLDNTESELFKLTEQNMKKSAVEIGGVVLQEIDAIAERRKNAVDGEVITGVSTGFRELDKLTSGWQKSDMIVLAARPGMGKTAFTLALARNAAIDAKKGVAFFSLEMSTNQLVARLISMETEISSDKLKKGLLLESEWKHLVKNIDNLKEAPIYIDDTPGIGIFELRAKCRRLKAKHDIQMIIIDYLQLMTGSVDGGNGNREQEISMISRNLKGIAKELEVPIIALSQLSRAVETRGGAKRPMLSDLRESGAIEQDADMVIFLYRPEYYKITQDEDGLDCRGIAEVIIAKHRSGSLETVKTRFVGKFAKFQDLEKDAFANFDADFNTPNTVTHQSKMNGGDENFPSEEFPVDDDTPF